MVKPWSHHTNVVVAFLELREPLLYSDVGGVLLSRGVLAKLYDVVRETKRSVTKLTGQRSKLVKIVFVQALTSPWIDALKKQLRGC